MYTFYMTTLFASKIKRHCVPLLSLCLWVSITGCASEKMATTTPEHPDFNASLVRERHSGLDRVYRLPGSDMSQYKKIYIEDIDFNDIKINTKRLTPARNEWAFTDNEKKHLTKYFRKQAALHMKKTGIQVTESTDADSLLLKTQFFEFTPSAAKDDSRSRRINEEVFTRNVGRLGIRFRLIDARTQETVLYIEDEEEVGDDIMLRRNDRVNNLQQFRLELDRWLRNMKKVVKAHEKKDSVTISANSRIRGFDPALAG